MGIPYKTDPGENAARKCKVFGVLSLFFFPPVFFVLSLINYRKYRETGNGDYEGYARTGKICSVVSIAWQGVKILIAGFLILLGIVTEVSTVTVQLPENSSYSESAGAPEYTTCWVVENSAADGLPL